MACSTGVSGSDTIMKSSTSTKCVTQTRLVIIITTAVRIVVAKWCIFLIITGSIVAICFFFVRLGLAFGGQCFWLCSGNVGDSLHCVVNFDGQPIKAFLLSRLIQGFIEVS